MFELDVTEPSDKPLRVTMGSYGIGVSRAVAALAEPTIDEYGLRWPHVVVGVHIVVADKGTMQQAPSKPWSSH